METNKAELRPEMSNQKKKKEESHPRTPLMYKIECLNSQGYDKEFTISEEGLKCLETGEVFQPEDIQLLEHQRFEGTSDPDDMAILYIIKTKSGLKGTVVNAFGVYADPDLFDFMKQVPDQTIDNITESSINNCWIDFQR